MTRKSVLMDTCRTCLKSPADKQISQLEKCIKDDNRKCIDIMAFCLDIKVAEDSKITTNLCNSCYKKIISFYKFKALSLKNDAYLRSLESSAELVDEKQSVYVDGNGIKHENPLETDEYGPSLVEDCNIEIKDEIDFKDEYYSFEELESFGDEEIDVRNVDILENDVTEFKNEQKLEDSELEEEQPNEVHKVENKNVKEKKTKEKAPIRSKRGRPKKAKWKPKRQVCEECGKSVLNIKEHSLQHRPREERQMLKCKACPKLFYSIRGQKKHFEVTHLGRKSKCDICNKEVINLKGHKKYHNPETLPYGCVQCERRFIAQSALDVHMVSHTKDLPFECDVCHNKFAAKNSVARHIQQVHQKIRSHKCHICSKSFFKIERLQVHVRLHTNERPYKCHKCDKAFSDSRYLKDHLLIHEGVKSFQCQHCDMSFVRNERLKVHMIKHTKEKRYPCGFCGVRFGRSDHRNRHEFTAHKKQRAAD